MPGAEFFRKCLLVHNSYTLSGNETRQGLPADWKAKMKAVCGRHMLDIEQREAVEQYLTHETTVCLGPPGT